MEVSDPNVPASDMAQHFAAASTAVAELLESTPLETSEEPGQRTQREGATPAAPEPPLASPAPGSPEPVEPPLPTVPPSPPSSDDDEAFRKELDEIKLPKNAHPNQAKAVNTIRGVAERERTHAREEKVRADKAEAEAAELRKNAITPELKSEMEELKQLRRLVNIKTDPEFKEKYTSKIETGNARATRILSSRGLDKAVMDDIAKMGGIAAAARSSEKVPASLDEEQPTWSEWVENTLMPKVPSVDRMRLNDIISTNANIEDEMQAEMEAVSADPASFEEKITKRNLAAMEVGMREVKTALGKLAEKWDIPANATPEQKAEIEKHNTRYDKVYKTVEEVASRINTDPVMQGRAALLMGQGIYLAEVNGDLVTTTEQQAARIKELSGELEAIKRSGSITPSLNVLPTSKDGDLTLKNLPDARSAVDTMLRNLE